MKRFVKVSDFVYWVEFNGYDEERKPKYIVCRGYYLASYKIGETVKNIVSLNDITSCVVRHLTNDKIFYEGEKAYKALKELQNE